jgi:5-methylcytosine-specific restriction endonuclease McrA
MSRTVEEWKGDNDDQRAPPRVRVRVFDNHDGRCHRCGRKIGAGESWTLEHLKALINGGANRESNLTVTCSWCVSEKNAEDVAEKASVYAKRAKHIGATEKRRWRW